MAGREGGREAFRNFDQEKKEDVRQAGRSAWAEASNYQQEGILHLIRNFDSITMFRVTHFIVNHFKTFKDPETGAYTNNCQGIHGVIKQDGRAESGPLRGLLEGPLDVDSLSFGGLRAHHPCLRRS